MVVLMLGYYLGMLLLFGVMTTLKALKINPESYSKGSNIFSSPPKIESPEILSKDNYLLEDPNSVSENFPIKDKFDPTTEKGITMMIDDVDQTNSIVNSSTSYYITRHRFFFKRSFKISINNESDSNIRKLDIQNLLLQWKEPEEDEPQDSQIDINIDLPGFDLKIARSTLKGNLVSIRANSANLSLAYIQYSSLRINCTSALTFIKSETYNSISSCQNEANADLFHWFFSDKENHKCDWGNSENKWLPYKSICEKSNLDELLPYNEASQALLAANITIEKSIIKGNTIVIANDLRIISQSTLSSINSGCYYDPDREGCPTIFISHSFSCGLNAGSHGGRGGVGISAPHVLPKPTPNGNTSQDDQTRLDTTFECLKSAFSRMSVYGSSKLAGSSGSAGTPFTVKDKSNTSPGVLSIITGKLFLDSDSAIEGGYSEEYKEAFSSSSGGSVSLVLAQANIQGKVTANGQSSQKEIDGEGGGGRISLYMVCWRNVRSHSDIAGIYNFSSSTFSVSPGKRPPFSSPELTKISTLIQAEKGVIGYTPCLKGHEGILCNKCPKGTQKNSMFDRHCQICDSFSNVRSGEDYYSGTRIYETENNCKDFQCNPELIELNVSINPYCLSSYIVFSTLLLNNIQIFGWVLLAVYLTFLICFINRRYNPKMQVKRQKEFPKEYYTQEYCIFPFQGRNTPQDPWFLELEISKDYKTRLIDRQEYMEIIREINQISRWKKKPRLLFSFTKPFPFISSIFLKKGQKKIVKSIQNTLDAKNSVWKRTKNLELSIWTCSEYDKAQLIISQCSQEPKEAQPVVIQMGGDLGLNNHLSLQVNPKHLYTQIRLISKGKPEDTLKEYHNRFYHINNLLGALCLYDPEIVFCNKVLNILNAIESTNKHSHVFGFQLSFIIIEGLKLKYQKAKYRYNQLYVLKTKSYQQIENFRQKLLEFEKNKDKFTYQYCLVLTPVSKVSIENLVSEKETQALAQQKKYVIF